MPDAVVAPDVDERARPRETPRDLSLRLARAKADAAGPHDGFVLAADTVVAVGRRVLAKAGSPAEARACLDLLSGRRHHVFSAVVVAAPDGRRAERVSESSVVLVRLTDEQKTAYLASGEWQGKAGGYAIQGRAAAYIRLLTGSYSGVVGLPLHETAQLLRGLGYRLP